MCATVSIRVKRNRLNLPLHVTCCQPFSRPMNPVSRHPASGQQGVTVSRHPKIRWGRRLTYGERKATTYSKPYDARPACLAASSFRKSPPLNICSGDLRKEDDLAVTQRDVQPHDRTKVIDFTLTDISKTLSVAGRQTSIVTSNSRYLRSISVECSPQKCGVWSQGRVL